MLDCVPGLLPFWRDASQIFTVALLRRKMEKNGVELKTALAIAGMDEDQIDLLEEHLCHVASK